MTKTKTKKIKKKAAGFDIMYRTVAAVLAFAMLPAVFFGSLVSYKIDLGALASLLSNAESGQQPAGLGGSISLYRLVKDGGGAGIFGENFDIKDMLLTNPHFKPVLVALILLAAALVIAVAVIFIAALTNKPVALASVSGAGFLCSLAAYISFTQFFAKPIATGALKISELFGVKQSLATGFIDLLGGFSVRPGTGFTAVLFLSAAVVIWAVAVIIVNAGEKKENKKAE